MEQDDHVTLSAKSFKVISWRILTSYRPVKEGRRLSRERAMQQDWTESPALDSAFPHTQTQIRRNFRAGI
ncbi:hypothetical protein PHLCEN_2v6959 [Hermanssonia centrifuga]|uniref:Uncharacterized protein n=1 Tax=Hermanssonia centrifuga TaxID=98765 RepID=A0A2R6NY52_9APHY|nr:hypothetical protein PHLCEN_2v6959 [Hermanssonia centrifuga]